MFDAITPSRIPGSPGMVAGYVAGSWPSYFGYTVNDHYEPSIRERFPHAIHVAIAVQAYQGGQVLDVEAGDATPAESVGWVRRMRRAGRIPTVYCNTSTWPAVRREFAAARVVLPLWWAAQYDGVAELVPGSIAKQYRNEPGYDVSVVADYWPGVDAARHAPAPGDGPQREDDEMNFGLIKVEGTTGEVYAWSAAGTWWHCPEAWRALVTEMPECTGLRVVSKMEFDAKRAISSSARAPQFVPTPAPVGS